MQREQAHAKWSARYTKAGYIERAAAHAARAAEYRLAGMSAFGVGGIEAASGALTAGTASAVLGIGANALAAIGLGSPAKTNSTAPGGFTVVQGLPSPGSNTTSYFHLLHLGRAIKEGANGRVHQHKTSPNMVVKQFHNPGSAASTREVKMYPVLSEIKRLTKGEFLTLNAEVQGCPLPSCLSIVMDKFVRQTDDYISGDPNDRLLTADKLRDAVGLGDPNDFQKAITDLLVQYKILHRFGVAHGDAHTGNSGLVVGAGSELPRFVIIDPTFSVVSPLSEHWDQIYTVDGLRVPGPPVMQHILPMMRAKTRQGMQTGGRYRFKLDELIRGLDDEWSVTKFLEGLLKGHKPMVDLLQKIDPGVDANGYPYPGSIIIIENIVDQHNAVIKKMDEDWTRLTEHIYPNDAAEGRKIVEGIRNARHRARAQPP